MLDKPKDERFSRIQMCFRFPVISVHPLFLHVSGQTALHPKRPFQYLQVLTIPVSKILMLLLMVEEERGGWWEVASL